MGPGSPHVALAPQACHVEGGSAGLVPSQLLEEKRKAFVKRDGEVAPSSGMDPPPTRPGSWWGHSPGDGPLGPPEGEHGQSLVPQVMSPSLWCCPCGECQLPG